MRVMRERQAAKWAALMVVFVVGTFVSLASPVSVKAFADGDGSEETPYRILY